MGRLADIAFINGQVITINQHNAVVEALAVKNNTIVFVGSMADAQPFVADAAEVIDLHGRSLTPGFIDAHEHLCIRGANAMGLDCRSPGVASIEDIKQLVRERAGITPKGQWIRGWGYDHSKLIEGRHPDRFDLDEVAPDHPVVLMRTCCHIAAFNSRALAHAGVADDITELAGGPVGQRNGTNNGVMFENACMEVLSTAQPSPDEMVDALSRVNGMLLAEGITSVHDAGAHGAASMKALQRASASGRLQPRVTAMLFALVGDSSNFSNTFIDSGLYTGFGNDRLRLGPIKMMIDGSSSGPTAATLEPYASMPDNCGLLSLTQEYVDDMVVRAHAAGYQVTAHAVGDKAVTMMLDAIEKALAVHPRADHRHRIEHCAMVNSGLLKRLKALGVVPVPQPIFLYEFGDGYLRNYGAARAEMMFACGAYLKEGILAAGSSDCPVTFSNPILNMHMAVNRQTQSGRVLGPDQRIPLMDALRMFTYNGAYASFDEATRGSLEVGKLADLAVLSAPILDVPEENIRDVRVDMTFIDGERLYTREL